MCKLFLLGLIILSNLYSSESSRSVFDYSKMVTYEKMVELLEDIKSEENRPEELEIIDKILAFVVKLGVVEEEKEELAEDIESFLEKL